MNEYTADFSFYNELRDFFSISSCENPLKKNYIFRDKPSVKDSIEAQGVPHTEVGLIIINGVSVGFGSHISDGEKVEVYPSFNDIDIENKVELRGAAEARFIADVHLGKLARLLRLMGFDTMYRNDYSDHEIAELASELDRIVLTRDRRLLKFSSITHGCWIRSHNPYEQLEEVLKRYFLLNSINSFNRCLECNGRITAVAKDSITGELETKTKLYYNEFFQCESCSKIYWKGSHYVKMRNLVEKLKAENQYN